LNEPQTAYTGKLNPTDSDPQPKDVKPTKKIQELIENLNQIGKMVNSGDFTFELS